MAVKLYTPSPALAGLISYYYCIDEPFSDGAELKKRVPDGSVELFFHYGSPFYTVSRAGESRFIKDRSLVLGQLQEFIQFKATGPMGFIGVKFKAQGFQRFVSYQIREFTDKVTNIKDIWGPEARDLEDRIAELDSAEERIRQIELFLLKRLTMETDPVLDHCLQLILQENGSLRVTELARQANISPRQLERKFREAVGLSPNSFSRIRRIQHTLLSLETNSHSSLTELGYMQGFYDQSHFIKEVDRFVGLTPKNIRLIEGCYSQTAFL